MVVKRTHLSRNAIWLFESRVILDGSQTILLGRFNDDGFESRVILDGSQTDDFQNLAETQV